MMLAALFRPLAASGAEPAIPQLGLWQSQMITYGHTLCDYLASPALPEEKLGHVYYDATRVFYQIARSTGDASWNTCAQHARDVYRDDYVIFHGGRVPGYMVFTTGLRMDYELTGSAASKTAAIDLAHNAAYAPDTTPPAETYGQDYSREVAYAILSHINAQALGAPARPRRIALVNQAYGHMNQWFVTRGWENLPPDPDQARIAPFMVGLTVHSLIRDWEETADPRLIPALRLAADWMFANAWVPAAEAMWYDNIDLGAAADLNLLIAPMYAFLYKQTGETKYRDQGDALFAGGVKNAFLDHGKQFDQNYWWSFDYIDYRSGGTTVPPAPVVGVTPASISFTGIAGGAAPDPKTVQISNTGTGTLSWSLSENSPWFSVDPLTGTAAGTVTIVPTSQGLSAGTYTETLTVSATGAASKDVSVTLTLTADNRTPVIAMSTTSMSFKGVPGGALPAAQNVQISNGGGGTLAWTAVGSPWLKLTKTGAGTLKVEANSAGVPAGRYARVIKVKAPGAAEATIRVTLTLTPAPTI